MFDPLNYECSLQFTQINILCPLNSKYASKFSSCIWNCITSIHEMSISYTIKQPSSINNATCHTSIKETRNCFTLPRSTLNFVQFCFRDCGIWFILPISGLQVILDLYQMR